MCIHPSSPAYLGLGQGHRSSSLFDVLLYRNYLQFCQWNPNVLPGHSPLSVSWIFPKVPVGHAKEIKEIIFKKATKHF